MLDVLNFSGIDGWGVFKLKDTFPTLFRIASSKNDTIADLWDRGGGRGGHWEVQFRRPFQNWEIEMLTQYLERI